MNNPAEDLLRISMGYGLTRRLHAVAKLNVAANVDTTLNAYTHVLDGSPREAVDKIDGELITIVHKAGKEDCTLASSASVRNRSASVPSSRS
jgi:hypothetical protein